MDVLQVLFLKVFAKTRGRGCRYPETEGTCASREDVPPDERRTGMGIRESYIQPRFLLSGCPRGEVDRTAWGSYTETAPPVLPANTCFPGFEHAMIVLAETTEHERADGIGSEDEGNDYERFHSSNEDGCSQEEQGPDVSGSGTRPMRRARDAHHPVSSGFFSDFVPTTLANYVNSSSLFGSTTRPAVTALRRISTSSGIDNRTSRRLTCRMAPRTHIWISVWFLLTAPIIFWDAAYCFMRPRSFKGGDLHWIWKPYEIYQEVDYVYGVEAYNRGDGFASAQSFMNVIETLLNLSYVYAQHVLESPAAPLIGVSAVVMTLSKTVLYWAQEYFCGGCAVGHNDLWTLFWFWILPNGLWLIVPSFIIASLTRDIVAGLITANKVDAAKKE